MAGIEWPQIIPMQPGETLEWWSGPGPKPKKDPDTKVWSDGWIDPLEQPFPDPNFTAPPYPFAQTKEQEKTEAATAKRYAEGGKIHKAAGPSQRIPKPGTSGCLYPKPNGREIGRMNPLDHQDWVQDSGLPSSQGGPWAGSRGHGPGVRQKS